MKEKIMAIALSMVMLLGGTSTAFASGSNDKVVSEDLAMAIAVYLLGFSSYSGFSSLIEGESEYEENFLKRIYTYAKILQ